MELELAELVELAELLGAPVMLEGVGSTCSFPFTHPLYAGSMPRLGAPWTTSAIKASD